VIRQERPWWALADRHTHKNSDSRFAQQV
jgi:hypothetical protein